MDSSSSFAVANTASQTASSTAADATVAAAFPSASGSDKDSKSNDSSAAAAALGYSAAAQIRRTQQYLIEHARRRMFALPNAYKEPSTALLPLSSTVAVARTPTASSSVLPMTSSNNAAVTAVSPPTAAVNAMNPPSNDAEAEEEEDLWLKDPWGEMDAAHKKLESERKLQAIGAGLQRKPKSGPLQELLAHEGLDKRARNQANPRTPGRGKKKAKKKKQVMKRGNAKRRLASVNGERSQPKPELIKRTKKTPLKSTTQNVQGTTPGTHAAASKMYSYSLTPMTDNACGLQSEAPSFEEAARMARLMQPTVAGDFVGIPLFAPQRQFATSVLNPQAGANGLMALVRAAVAGR